MSTVPTYRNHHLLRTLTTETPAVAPMTLYSRLSTVPHLKRNSATTPPSPHLRTSLSSSSSPPCLPTLKSWNPLSLSIPSTVQTTTIPSSSSQDGNSTSKIPFVSSSWANASFLNVEVVDPIDADPFLEKRHDYHHSIAAANAALLDPEIVLKMRPERMEEDEVDGMLSDCEESDTDTDQDLDADDYGDFEGVDIHNADAKDKDGGYLSDAGGAGTGAGAGGAHKTETIGTAHQCCNVFGEGRNGVSGDEEGRLGVEKLTQGILALQLDTSNNNNTRSHRVDVAKTTKLKFPKLEYRYRGPPPSPSWPSSPRSETESVSSSSITTPVASQNNGVTVRGSYVIIKMPKNREPVVTMPKGFTSVTVILPSTTAEESGDVEENENGKKRNSENLKIVEGTEVSLKKRC